jgi:DNA-binding protein WhiA
MPLDVKGSEFELAGLLLGLSKQNSGDERILYGSRIWVFKRAILLCKQSYAQTINLAQCMKIPPNYKGKIKLTVNEDVFEKLTSASPFTSKRKSWHWLRGLYGSCGNIFFPKSGYYLVLRVRENDIANKAGMLLELRKCDFSRRSNYGVNELMIRKQENIVHFLSGIGMNELTFRIEDMAIFRAMRDRANKIVNCDSANISKSLRVAEELVAIAKKIKSMRIYEKLPNQYKELIEVRLENPEDTLSEIGSLLTPSISKSTVKYRWDRLQDFVKANSFE